METGIRETAEEAGALTPVRRNGISAEALHWVVAIINMLVILALFILTSDQLRSMLCRAAP